MLQQGLIKELEATETFFLKTIETLTAADALYRPDPEMYTVTAHLDHVADSITWFMDGAFKHADGFAMNFEEMIVESHKKKDFDAAKQKVISAFADARAVIAKQSEADLFTPLPDGPIMGGAPKLAVISGITDHTAHHRGCLAVYTRLLGKVPAMPYV